MGQEKTVPLPTLSLAGRGASPSPGFLQEAIACGLLTELGETPEWLGGRNPHFDIRAGNKRIQVKSSAASSQQFDSVRGNELPAVSVTLPKTPQVGEVDEFLLVVLPAAVRNNRAPAVLMPSVVLTPTDDGFNFSVTARVVVDRPIEIWRMPVTLVCGPEKLFSRAFARSGKNKGAPTTGSTLQAKRSCLEDHPDVTRYLLGTANSG